MDGAFEFIELAQDHNKHEMLAVLQGHVGDLLAWLEAFARIPSWGVPDRPADYNPTTRMNRLIQMQVKNRPFLWDLSCLERIVEYAFWVWMELPSPADRVAPAEHSEVMECRLFLLSKCAMDDTIRRVVFQKLNDLDKRGVERLAAKFVSRLLEWAKVYRPVYEQNVDQVSPAFPGHIVAIAWGMNSNRRFSRALRRADFPKFVLQVAAQFRDLPPPVPSLLGNPENTSSRPGSLISSLFFDYACVILGDLSNSLGGVQYYQWDEETGDSPLERLFSLCHHPQICRAILEVLEREVFKNPLFLSEKSSDHWTLFLDFMAVHERALLKAESTKGLTCDSLEHHPEGNVREVPQAKECAQCGWVFYCSRECQKRDWRTVHRQECLGNRVGLIELQRQGVRLLRECRRFEFILLEAFLKWALPTIQSVEGSVESGKPKRMAPEMGTRCRVETVRLLNEAERGSLSYLERLNDDWPRDIGDSKRALAILLRHFQEQAHEIPELVSESGQLSRGDSAHMLSLVMSCLRGMDGALKFIDQAEYDYKRQMVAVLERNVGDYLSWLDVFARIRNLPSELNISAELARHNATSRINNLLDIQRDFPTFLEETNCLERVVDYALWVWLEGWSPAYTVVLKLDKYADVMGNAYLNGPGSINRFTTTTLLKLMLLSQGRSFV
ncbi:hypothetical protein NMY22_g14876 [Coprinellus aureogranulatus]|nr:hypothetical protein NMY22_g14876 [Coprinellus aureogranulatus]